MGSYAEKMVNGQVVAYDTQYPYRWLDAWGPAVTKFLEDFVGFALQAVNQPAWGTATLVNASTLAAATASQAGSGELLITTAGAENDGVNLQVNGEAFLLSGNLPTYFGIRLKANEATQNDFLAGLCITDTDLLGGLTDGVFFRKIDGETSVAFVVCRSSAETVVSKVQTFDANAYHTYEFVYDGTNVNAYIDGTLVATIAATNTNFPNTEYLTPSLHYLTGAVAVKTMTVDWIRAIQITAG